ncbi:MAG: phytanoyl-CoA dioxygenase family protein [Alphaproteobacteria bacterium]|nr:phytanoyl-CoA dioxygenase family protein [Alphaproteobacteria bacterium]
MVTTPVLSAEQIGDFKHDGFVVTPGVFNAAEVAVIDAAMNDLVALPEEPGKHWVYWEESRLDPAQKIISRIENISPYVPGFKELSDVLEAPVGQLLGEKAALFKEKINFKYPGADGFKPHQDSQAGWWDYADYFITVMVCVDEATEENGCLQLVAGHHQKGLIREWEPLNEEDTGKMDFIMALTKPGDVAYFDSYAPHGSEPNMSDTMRRLYFATYSRLSDGDFLDQYYADKRKTYPPDIEREAGREYKFRV